MQSTNNSHETHVEIKYPPFLKIKIVIFRVSIEYMVKLRLVKIFTFIYNLKFKYLTLFIHICSSLVIQVRNSLSVIYYQAIDHKNHVLLILHFSSCSFVLLFFWRSPLITRFFQPLSASCHLNICSIQMSLFALFLFSIFYLGYPVHFINFNYDVYGV